MNKNMRKMYTEEQIGNIAKSSVSGGTQLYKHTVRYDTPGDICIISNDSRKITNVSELSDALRPSYFIKGYLSGPNSMFIFRYSDGLCGIKESDGSYIVQTVTSIASDTVTPL